MAEDVYAVPDLTKKVRYRREREQETEDRGEREERLVDIYVSADHPDPGPGLGAGPKPGPDPDPDPDPGTQLCPAVQQNTAQQQHGGSDQSWKKNAFKAATVCLGVLCVILLAGITGLGVRNSKLIQENNNLTNLTKGQHNLRSKYDNLANGQVHLQSKHDNLAKDLEQMANQKDDLLSRYNDVTAELDELKKRLRLCELSGWQTFGKGCYYISTEERTWEESRKYCRENQSDLIIISSKEEQDFVNRVNKYQKVWLGLTDREEEGVWKWVDGTPLTSPEYWHRGEPLVGEEGEDEDCAMRNGGAKRTGWYDESCTEDMLWICEKAL